MFILAAALMVQSCGTIDLYEKNVSIPGYTWSSNFRPEFSFEVKDTTAAYDIYVVLRHTEKYNWNNIWLELSTRGPLDTVVRREKYELLLATNKQWLGSAMDDIYEHRVRISPTEGVALHAGTYTFSIGHIMREDPLRHVMNIGLRVEKKPTSFQN